MRVLAITNMYPSQTRPGWGSFVRSQVESLRKAGIDIDILVIEGYSSRWAYLQAIGRMRKMLRETSYDLIHAHYGLSGLVARFQFHVPVVVSFCGDDLYGHSDVNGRRIPTSMPLAWIHRQLSRFVDSSIVKSRAMSALLPKPDAAVIPNGVDMEVFRPVDRLEARRILGLDPDTTYVLFPYAPDRPRKNFDALVSAVALVAAQRQSRRIEIFTVSKEPQQRIPLYMSAADVLVVPSFWEGSPNAVKEALACNLKVVATDVGDVRERLEGVSGTALCLPTPQSIADGIMTVLDDKAEVRGRQAIAALNIAAVADRIVGVYKSVLAARTKERRALIIVENLPVPFDRRVWQEAKALRDAGWLVRIICPKRGPFCASRETIDGIHVYRHPLPEARRARGYPVEYGTALFWQLFLSTRIYLRHGFDIIHACNPPDMIFLVAAPFKLLGVRFIFDHHDLCPELALSKFGTGRKGAIMQTVLKTLERMTFRLANASIATNESYRAVALRRGYMNPDRVFVVRSAPDLTYWQPVEPDPEVRRDARFLIGYVGVMGHQEGLSNLLTTAAHVIHGRGRKDVRFLLIGSGPELPSLREETKALGLEPWVEFTGRVSDEDLIRFLSSCDICVNSDLATPFNNLSSMNKIVEYMALGKPIVQVDLAEGRATAMEAAVCAAADDPVDFGDKILSLLADPEQRARMGEIGRKRVVETLAWTHQVPQLLACYDQALNQSTTSGKVRTTAYREPRFDDSNATKAVGEDHV